MSSSVHDNKEKLPDQWWLYLKTLYEIAEGRTDRSISYDLDNHQTVSAMGLDSNGIAELAYRLEKMGFVVTNQSEQVISPRPESVNLSVQGKKYVEENRDKPLYKSIKSSRFNEPNYFLLFIYEECVLSQREVRNTEYFSIHSVFNWEKTKYPKAQTYFEYWLDEGLIIKEHDCYRISAEGKDYVWRDLRDQFILDVYNDSRILNRNNFYIDVDRSLFIEISLEFVQYWIDRGFLEIANELDNRTYRLTAKGIDYAENKEETSGTMDEINQKKPSVKAQINVIAYEIYRLLGKTDEAETLAYQFWSTAKGGKEFEDTAENDPKDTFRKNMENWKKKNGLNHYISKWSSGKH